MKSVAQGKIFLADQRGVKQTHQLKRWSTFNFEDFNDVNKTAIDRLYLLNDDHLAGWQRTAFEIAKDSYVFVLPITGAVNYADDKDNETDIDVEEALIVFAENGTRVRLTNPFKNDVVNYLCICLKADEIAPNTPQFFRFDLTKGNELLKVNANSLPFKFSIGRFDGRKEATVHLSFTSTFYAFVISGAFEVDGRLLHEKDGLALWDTNKIELEALSNNAIILTIEIFSQAY